ncbi:YceI family protein [Agrobacterium tumefaciens]|nr:YceI family protein [Agrobacterium tumefaciens]NTE26314.1 YceI family protein [Agrobacterium tumefaciens]
MKKILFLAVMGLFCLPAFSQIISTNKAQVSFYSKTPLEDIEAKSVTGNSVIDVKTGKIIFRLSNRSFEFPKKLMQEHFNENYMESDKYPTSEFKGTLSAPVNLAKDGLTKMDVDGTLTVHGVTKPCKAKVDILVSKGTVSATSTFKIKIADHKIEIPTIVFKKIAEEIDVRIQATYIEKK